MVDPQDRLPRSSHLILIGDPKQAIYAFRGADVFSYLDAADHADHRATLLTNWRSDHAVVSGIEAAVGGMQLGDPRITVHPVAAAHEKSRLHGVGGQARVRLRTVPTTDDKPPRSMICAWSWLATSPQTLWPCSAVPADCSAQTGVCGRSRPATSRSWSANTFPGRTGTRCFGSRRGSSGGDDVDQCLRHRRRPAMGGSARGHAATLATMLRAAALGFHRLPPSDLALRGDHIDDDVALRLRTWAQTLERTASREMVARIEQETALSSRVLSQPHGERQLTDLRHVAGALHAQQRLTKVGLVGLSDWLSSQIRRTTQSDREPTSELTRRLESDADAVQVLTVHVSKGLEFPVVYVPFGWDRFPAKPEGPLLCHDASGRRVLDVRGVGALDAKTCSPRATPKRLAKACDCST